jgi:hypothetical protein
MSATKTAKKHGRFKAMNFELFYMSVRAIDKKSDASIAQIFTVVVLM